MALKLALPIDCVCLCLFRIFCVGVRLFNRLNRFDIQLTEHFISLTVWGIESRISTLFWGWSALDGA